MYINSTNLPLFLPDYNTNVSYNWISSEKYYNCDNFFSDMTMPHKKRKMLWKKR